MLTYCDHLYKMFDKKDQLIIFEAGSYNGAHGIRYAKMFPNSKVFSFEPVESNYRWTLDNLRGSGYSERIELRKLALGPVAGKFPFYHSSGRSPAIKIPQKGSPSEWSASGSLLKSNNAVYPKFWTWLEFKDGDEEIVDVVTLKEAMKLCGVEKIDFLHLDVQGSELDVLRSAGDKLKCVYSMWIEISVLPVYKDQPLKNDIDVFLSDSGYEMVFMGDPNPRIQTNQLWKRKS